MTLTSSVQARNDVNVDKSIARKAYLYVLAPLFIASILAFLDRVNVSFAELQMGHDLGFDAKIYGFGAGIFFAGYVIFEVPGSILAEKWSPSKWIARIMFTWGAVCMVMAFMTEAWHFYVLRFLLGACEASLYPVIYACIIPRWFTEANRARAISLTLTSLLVSAILGAPLAGWLVSLTPFGFRGWQAIFLLEGGVTCLYGFFILKFLSDNPRQVSWLTEDEKNYLVSTLDEENARKTGKAHYSLAQALTNPRVLRLCFTYFSWLIGFWGFNFFLPQILKEASRAYGWTNLTIGFVSTLPMIAALIGMVLIGNSASSRNESRLHVGCTLFLGFVGYILLAATWGNLMMSVISLTILAVGVYSAMGTWWSIPTTFLTGTAAAGAVGMINSVGNIGGFSGPYLLGWVKAEYNDMTIAFYILGAFVLLSSVLVLTLKRQE